jgi:hypothetical protein
MDKVARMDMVIDLPFLLNAMSTPLTTALWPLQSSEEEKISESTDILS